MIMQDFEHPNKNIKPVSNCLNGRQSWLDKFLPEKTWIDTIKATSNNLANFD